MESALDQAFNNIKSGLGAIGQGIGNFVQQSQQPKDHEAIPANPVQQFAQQAQQALGQLPNALNFDPTANGGNNFWSTPVAQGLAALQPRAENILQGASLGYYKPDQQLQQQYNVSPFEGALETGAAGAVPFVLGSVATGGALDAALAPEAIAALGGRELLTTAGAGALTGAAAPADSIEQRLENTGGGLAGGAAFGLLGGANPLIQAGLGSLGAAGLTAAQGGNNQQVLASAVLGAGTPLFFKAVDSFGGNASGEKLMGQLYDKFGSDAYRFMANKDLIQRVVTGQGSPDDVAAFHVLNSLGQENAGTAPANPNEIPQSGPVWEFLQSVFPSSFKEGAPVDTFTDPSKTPLQHLQEMQLDPHENDALMQIDEKNPHPDTVAPSTEQAIAAKSQEIANGASQGLAPEAEAASAQIKPGTQEPQVPSPIDEGNSPSVQEKVNAIQGDTNVMANPEVVQHAPTLRKAIRVYNAAKDKNQVSLATLTDKVPGLDVALDAIRSQGTDITDAQHLVNLSKALPRRNAAQMKVAAPQTAAEAIAANKMRVATQETPTAETSAQPVITDPNDPNYDFAADMEANVGKGINGTSAEQQGEALRQGVGKNSVDAAGSGNATDQNLPTRIMASGAKIKAGAPGGGDPGNPTGINFESQPKGGYVDELQRAVSRITGDGPNSYGNADRQTTKIVLGRKVVNEDIGQGDILKWINKTLPDSAARERVGLALDDAGAAQDLKTPEEKVVYDQLKGLNELMGIKEQEMNPNFKTIDNYFQRRDVSPLSDEEKSAMKTGKNLSQTSKANVQRTIWKFIPEDGQGTSFVDSTASKSFPLHQAADDRMVWEDAQGKRYSMNHATIPEAEQAGFGPFEKDAGKVAGQSITDFLNKKEHIQAVNYLKSDAASDSIFSPGDPKPEGAKAIAGVPGMEGYYGTPQAVHAIENLSRDPNISGIEKAYGSAEKYVTNLIFFNALKHPLNMVTNALAFAGNVKTGNPILDSVGLNGPVGAGKFISNLQEANDVILNRPQKYWDMKDQGSAVGDFDRKPTQSLIQRQGATTGPGRLNKVIAKTADPIGIYKGNKAAVSYFDDLFRTSLTLTYEKSGMPLSDAVKEADRRMVDYGNLSRNEKRGSNLFGMFYPWLKGLVSNYATMAQHPLDNRGAMMNHLLMGAAGIGATLAWKQMTGNNNASVDQYGDISLADQAYKSIGDIQRGTLPRIVTSHFGRPLAKEAVQQAFNQDIFSGRKIYDSSTQGFNGQNPPTETQARLTHLANGVVAPLAPFLKVAKGSQTSTEAVLNYLGLRSPHATGYAGLPAKGDQTFLNLPGSVGVGPLAVDTHYNEPGANTATTGIDYLNNKSAITGKLAPEQQSKLDVVNKLISDQYNGGNPLSTIQAYSILQNDPQLALAKSMIQVEQAKAQGKDANPLWAMGLTNPDMQKVVLQYKGLLPADQKAFKATGNHQQVLNMYNDMQNSYYAKNATPGDKTGFQAVAPSKEVSDLLNQYDATKSAGKPNYALLDDPRVQNYFAQKDQYDGFVNSLAGLSATGASSGSKGYSSYGSGATSASGITKAELAYRLRSQLFSDASVNMPTIKLAASTGGPKLMQIKAHGNPASQQPSVKLPAGVRFGQPQVGKVGFSAPSSSRISLAQPKYAP